MLKFELNKIEDEILESQNKLDKIKYNYGIQGEIDESGELESVVFEYKSRKRELELKRQFILDKRNGWKQRLFWSAILPIIIAIITTYLLLYFGLV